jgi:hypothetical protein
VHVHVKTDMLANVVYKVKCYPSVPKYILMTSTPVMNYVELTCVTNVTTLKSLLVTVINVVAVDSIYAIIDSRQWTTSIVGSAIFRSTTAT